MSPEATRIEADLNRSRHALNDTIEALGAKLSPGQLLDEAIGLAKGQAGQFTANLGRQVRDNPLPLLLIGAGVGMLFMNGQGHDHSDQKHSSQDTEDHHRFRKLEEARAKIVQTAGETQEAFLDRLHDAEAAALGLKRDAEEAMDSFKSRVKTAGAQLAHSVESLGDRIKSGAADLKHSAEHTAHAAKAGFDHARHDAKDLFEQHPIVAGAVGMAIGALIGAAAPLSSLERDKLGGVSAAAARGGARLAEKGARKVADVADAATAELH